MNKFQPLDMQRAIRSDDQLTTPSEVALLLCAVLRTDNGSRKVRASLALLAKDANCSERTARTAFKNPQVLKYFKRVDRRTRRINLWFYPTPAMVAGVEVGESAEPTPAIEDDSGNGCHDSGNGCHDSGNGCRPSAFASASSSAKDSAPVADAPSAHEDEESMIRKEMIQGTTTHLNAYEEDGGTKKQEATASSNSKEDEAEESTNTKTQEKPVDWIDEDIKQQREQSLEAGREHLEDLIKERGLTGTPRSLARSRYEDGDYEPSATNGHRRASLIIRELEPALAGIIKGE